MSKEQKDNVIDLLFEIYDSGVQNKTIDLASYLNDITKALSLNNISEQSEQLCECKDEDDKHFSWTDRKGRKVKITTMSDKWLNNIRKKVKDEKLKQPILN